MVEAARTTTFSPRYPAAARSFFTLLRSFGPRVISIPTSLAVGVPGTNNPTSVLIRLGSAPATAVMTSFWSSAESTTRRTAALSNGGNSWLKRRQPISPVRSLTVMTSLLLRFSCGTRSIVGFSHQSTSPWSSATDAVPGSGTKFHTTRSTWTIFGPAVKLGLPLAHDRAVGLGQRLRQQRKGLLQAKADELVGDRRKLVGAGHQGRAHR